MSIENLPPLSEDICTRVKALAADPAVARALDIAREEAPFALEEQISLCEIPAPTFEEDARAEEVARRLRACNSRIDIIFVTCHTDLVMDGFSVTRRAFCPSRWSKSSCGRHWTSWQSAPSAAGRTPV